MFVLVKKTPQVLGTEPIVLTGRSGLHGEGEETQTSDLVADVMIFLASEVLKAALTILSSSGM